MEAEASFKSRVHHVFGGLLGASRHEEMFTSAPSEMSRVSSASASSGPGDSWSVSEVAIPCNGGRQDLDASSGSDNDEPCAAAKRYAKFVQLTERARKRRAAEDDGLDDEEGWERARNAKRSRSGDVEDEASPSDGQPDFEEDDECREMRMMVGMDDTLDFEEEEDEYDKLAVGREGDSERMYMREIKGTGGMDDSSAALESSKSDMDSRGMRRDSRANHAAAAARLKEDDRLASADASGPGNLKDKASPGHTTKAPLKGILKTSRSSKVGDMKVSSENGVTSDSTPGKSEVVLDGEAVAADSSTKTSDLSNAGAKQKTRKRVRFAPDEKASVEEEDSVHDTNSASLEEEDSVHETSSADQKVSGIDVEKIIMSMGRKSRVPDYVLNPSKYTHYTLDWSDEEDQSNMANEAAFQATRTLTSASVQDEEMSESQDLPTGITFVKRGSGVKTNKANGEAKLSLGPVVQQSQSRLSFSEDVVTDSPNAGEALVETILESKATRIFRRRTRDESEDDDEVEDSTS